MMIVYRTALLVLLLMFASNNLVAKGGLSLRSALQQGWSRGFSTVVIGGLLWCGGITGCERSLEHQVVNIIGEKQEGEKDIIVEIDGVQYFGYLGADEYGRLQSVIADETGPIRFLHHTDSFVGNEIASNDIGRAIYIVGTRDGRAVHRHGVVDMHFDNDLYLLQITHETYVDTEARVEGVMPYLALARHYEEEARYGGFIYADD